MQARQNVCRLPVGGAVREAGRAVGLGDVEVVLSIVDQCEEEVSPRMCIENIAPLNGRLMNEAFGRTSRRGFANLKVIRALSSLAGIFVVNPHWLLWASSAITMMFSLVDSTGPVG